jgi:hypothetical protein
MTRHDTTTTFRLPQDTLDALNEIKDRDGIPVSEQMRRAIHTWIETKLGRPLPPWHGLTGKARKRAEDPFSDPEVAARHTATTNEIRAGRARRARGR